MCCLSQPKFWKWITWIALAWWVFFIFCYQKQTIDYSELLKCKKGELSFKRSTETDQKFAETSIHKLQAKNKQNDTCGGGEQEYGLLIGMAVWRKAWNQAQPSFYLETKPIPKIKKTALAHVSHRPLSFVPFLHVRGLNPWFSLIPCHHHATKLSQRSSTQGPLFFHFWPNLTNI